MIETATPKLLLSSREAARSLGICAKTLWSITQPRGDVPTVRIGTRCLYDPRDLLAWIDARKSAAPGISPEIAGGNGDA